MTWSHAYSYSAEGDLLADEGLSGEAVRYQYDAAHRLDLGLLRLEVWAGPKGLRMLRSLEVERALALRVFELRPLPIELAPEGRWDDDLPA